MSWPGEGIGGNQDAEMGLAGKALSGDGRCWQQATVIRVISSQPSGGDHVRLLLGAYLVGGVPEDDAVAIRAHLEVCISCAAEFDDLAPVAGWLSLLAEAQQPRRELPHR
jgi:putative zinc finger protein